MIEFKELTYNDLPIVKTIYEYYIQNSTATFHIGEITNEALLDFLPINEDRYKSYLIYFNNEVAGYCYMGPYKKRQAYYRSAEVTLYLKPEFCGKGIGKTTLNFIEALAPERGIKTLLGIISGDNTESIILFEKCGYEKCAHFKNVGEKFGKILDVVAYQKELA